MVAEQAAADSGGVAEKEPIFMRCVCVCVCVCTLSWIVHSLPCSLALNKHTTSHIQYSWKAFRGAAGSLRTPMHRGLV